MNDKSVQVIKQLIKQLYTSDQEVMAETLLKLRKAGWLTDGTLKGYNLAKANLQYGKLILADFTNCDLSGANLENAFLMESKLSGAKMVKANLDFVVAHRVDWRNANFKGASLRCADLRNTDLSGAKHLTDQQLVHVRMLRQATMPDGQLYDGRYNLPTGLASAQNHSANINSPEAMAKWYKVPLERYQAGQQWAREHLRSLREHDDPCP